MVLLRKKGLPRPSGVLNINFSFRSSKGNINSRLKRGGGGGRGWDAVAGEGKEGKWARKGREVGVLIRQFLKR